MTDEVSTHHDKVQQDRRDLGKAHKAPSQLPYNVKLPWFEAQQLQRFLVHATVRHRFNCYLFLGLYLSKRHSPLDHRGHPLCYILAKLRLRARRSP